jgi:hypothetical protein
MSIPYNDTNCRTTPIALAALSLRTPNTLLLCKAQNAVTQWNASISKLKKWLTKAATMPDLQHAILSYLTFWKMNSEIPIPQYHWPGVNDLIKVQSKIGWRAFLEGEVLKDWEAKQAEYYVWLKKRNTGRRWTITLIKKLWEISWDMWLMGSSQAPTISHEDRT